MGFDCVRLAGGAEDVKAARRRRISLVARGIFGDACGDWVRFDCGGSAAGCG